MENIRVTPAGTYQVIITVKKVKHTRTFKTKSEAISFRNMMKQSM